MEVKLVVLATRQEDSVNVPGKAYVFDNAEVITIGRGETNDVPLTDPERTISRNHLQLVKTDKGYVVKDLNSKNFSFINEERITSDESRLLYNGDSIRLGDFELEYTLIPATIIEATMLDPMMAPPDYGKNNPFLDDVEEIMDAWKALTERYEASTRKEKKEYLNYALKKNVPAIEGNHIVQLFANLISETQLTGSTQMPSGKEE